MLRSVTIPYFIMGINVLCCVSEHVRTITPIQVRQPLPHAVFRTSGPGSVLFPLQQRPPPTNSNTLIVWYSINSPNNSYTNINDACRTMK